MWRQYDLEDDDVSQSDFRNDHKHSAAVRAMEIKIAHLEDRLTRTERQITMPVPEQICGKDETENALTVAQNIMAIRRAVQLMSIRVARDELKTAEADFGKKIWFCLEELKTLKCLVASSTASIDAIREKLDVFRDEIKTKVDRTESTSLKADVTFVASNLSKFDKASEEVSELRNQIFTLSENISNNQVSTGEVSEQVKKLLEDKLDRCDVIKNDVAEIRQRLDGTADHKEVERLDRELAHIREGHESLRVEHERSAGDLIVEASRARKAFEEALSGVRVDMCSRATEASVHFLGASVGELARSHVAAARKADLAMQFVDWYSRRGETYERNK